MVNMARWSNDKLDKELAFAEAFGIYDANSKHWLEMLMAEKAHRLQCEGVFNG